MYNLHALFDVPRVLVNMTNISEMIKISIAVAKFVEKKLLSSKGNRIIHMHNHY